MQCPICKRQFQPAPPGEKSRFLPFCSARCRDIDLGRWLDGKYQIPSEPEDDEGDVTPPPAEPND